MIAEDLTRKVPEADLPVYLFHGKYDYTISSTLAREYFDELQAPVKGFYTFEQSAHSPMFEEPWKMKQIMQQDVLTGHTRLADGT